MGAVTEDEVELVTGAIGAFEVVVDGDTKCKNEHQTFPDGSGVRRGSLISEAATVTTAVLAGNRGSFTYLSSDIGHQPPRYSCEACRLHSFAEFSGTL